MKKKLTLNIDEGIIDLAKMDNINISEIVGLYLEKYLSVNGVDAIDEKIKKVNDELAALNDRKKELIRTCMDNTKDETIRMDTYNQLIGFYTARREQLGDNIGNDEEWIMTPKNIQRCHMIGKDPLMVLHDLRKWYKANKGVKENEKQT